MPHAALCDRAKRRQRSWRPTSIRRKSDDLTLRRHFAPLARPAPCTSAARSCRCPFGPRAARHRTASDPSARWPDRPSALTRNLARPGADGDSHVRHHPPQARRRRPAGNRRRPRRPRAERPGRHPHHERQDHARRLSHPAPRPRRGRDLPADRGDPRPPLAPLRQGRHDPRRAARLHLAPGARAARPAGADAAARHGRRATPAGPSSSRTIPAMRRSCRTTPPPRAGAAFRPRRGSTPRSSSSPTTPASTSCRRGT